MKIAIMRGIPRANGNTAAMVEAFATDCGIVTSDNSTNRTPAKLRECYVL